MNPVNKPSSSASAPKTKLRQRRQVGPALAATRKLFDDDSRRVVLWERPRPVAAVPPLAESFVTRIAEHDEPY